MCQQFGTRSTLNFRVLSSASKTRWGSTGKKWDTSWSSPKTDGIERTSWRKWTSISSWVTTNGKKDSFPALFTITTRRSSIWWLKFIAKPPTQTRCIPTFFRVYAKWRPRSLEWSLICSTAARVLVDQSQLVEPSQFFSPAKHIGITDLRSMESSIRTWWLRQLLTRRSTRPRSISE